MITARDLLALATVARSEQPTWWLWDEPPMDGRGPMLAFASAATPEAITAIITGMGALVATSRCYRRPDSKLDPDPGPCGKCAVCRARVAYYGTLD